MTFPCNDDNLDISFPENPKSNNLKIVPSENLYSKIVIYHSLLMRPKHNFLQ